MGAHLLAIDQGTTSTRAIIYDAGLTPLAEARREFPQHFPRPGWVEHDPEDLWSSTLATCREALARAGVAPAALAGVGITNQRETTVLWDRTTGRALHRAIVWQDRRTAPACAALRERGLEPLVTERTGLLLDPYFSATKIAWLLDHVEGARALARRGRLAFGTVDSFLLWRLTGGRVHATDATNASRTLLYDIGRGRWDEELLDAFDIPESLLPEVRDNACAFGTSEEALLGGSVVIAGMAGDQQAATVGQACFAPGMIKSTYGTGCFAVLNTGEERVRSANRLLTTVAYRFDGRATYALEGSIFVAGAAVQWLRDALGVVKESSEVTALAGRADPQQELYLVPAFTGLGAPYWDAEARGAVFGLTRASGAAELARAALEAVGFQTRDLLEAMRKDWPAADAGTVLRVDGGMVASDWAMQFLADILGAPVDRPRSLETTARGAAYLAGLTQGLCPAPAEFQSAWEREHRFEPRLEAGERERRYAGWKEAVRRTLSER